MDETTFLNEGEVSVTNARFMARGQTYAMSGITSVKSFRQNPSRKGPAILAGVAILVMIPGGKAVFVALLMLAGAAFWWFKQQPEYSVRLSTASGESDAFASMDQSFITRIVNAVNNAIVQRG